VDDFETWVDGEVTPTLNAFDNNGDTRATVLIFYGNRVDDLRVQGPVINTLQARMGTGGNNMPMLAYPIQGTVIGRSDTAGPQGKGYGNPEDPMFTIDTVGGHAVAHVGNFELYDFPKEGVAPTLNAKRAKDTMAYGEDVVAYDEFNDSISDTHHTLRAGTKQSTGVVAEAVVRRLTPLECERLQGFPDGWTDSQSDSQRYKQMGNAVAVPVVQWIINRLVEVNNGLDGGSKE
jgi:DNA (cytosine-5)-methyltransferase 1